MELNLMGLTPNTTVNGPGNRFLIHFQGCNLVCPNCFNPESWSFKAKKLISVESLADTILNSKTDGISISGGEPFLQPEGLLHLLEYLHRDGSPFQKGVLIFTGFYEHELKKIPEYEKILKFTDVIISGRYNFELRVYGSMLSSSNQKFIWGGKGLIKEEELMNQDFEIIIESDGLKLTGFPNLSKEIHKELIDLGVNIKVKK